VRKDEMEKEKKIGKFLKKKIWTKKHAQLFIVMKVEEVVQLISFLHQQG